MIKLRHTREGILNIEKRKIIVTTIGLGLVWNESKEKKPFVIANYWVELTAFNSIIVVVLKAHACNEQCCLDLLSKRSVMLLLMEKHPAISPYGRLLCVVVDVLVKFILYSECYTVLCWI